MFDDRSKTKYCKAPSSPADFELLENYNYSFPACLKDCLLRDIAQTCQCIDNTVRPPPILTSPCATFTGCAVWLQVWLWLKSVIAQWNVTTQHMTHPQVIRPIQLDLKSRRQQSNTTWHQKLCNTASLKYTFTLKNWLSKLKWQEDHMVLVPFCPT